MVASAKELAEPILALPGFFALNLTRLEVKLKLYLARLGLIRR
jgi:hypothetical protein